VILNKKVQKKKTSKTGTAGGKISTLLSIIKRAEEHNLIDFQKNGLNRYKRPKSREEDNDIYLTENEIEKMYNLTLTGREEVVRDLFVLQCWTGQRVSDMPKLSKGIIKENEKGKSIEIVQTKKNHKVTIPLLPMAINILEKYNYNLPTENKYGYSTFIKTVGKKAGITDLCNITEDRGGEIITKQVEKFEIMKTHTARRSFITNMLKRGYDRHLIMKITGHKSVESFARYVKLSSEDAAMQILENEQIREESQNPATNTPPNEPKSDKPVSTSLSSYAILETLFAYKEVNEASNLVDNVGYIRDDKIYDYQNELSSLKEKIVQYLSKDKSELDIVKQYIKNSQSLHTLVELGHEFQVLAYGYYPKIGLNLDTILAFIKRAEYIGIISEEIGKQIAKMAEDVISVRDRG